MRIGWKILLVLVILLSLATGATKIAQMPEEMQLFGNAGFNTWATVLFGLVQIAGGMMMAFRKTRKIGAIIMTMTFAAASIVVFVNEMMAFGLVSLLFIAASAVFVVHPAPPPTQEPAA